MKQTKKRPWVVTDTKSIYKNPWISVKEDKVIRPDGTPGIFGVISVRSGISVLPIDNNNNVYLVKDYRYALERVTIESVSGGIEDEEDMRDTASRELREETGLVANRIETIKLPFKEALEWVREKKITHAATVVLILKAKEYLNI